MSSTDSPAGSKLNTHARIPALLTTSFQAVTEAFGADLVEISAHGSVTTSNSAVIDDLREYFVTRDQDTNHGISIEYSQQAGAKGPHNPLTADARQQILDEVEAALGTEERRVAPDLTVTSCTVRVTDDRLQAVTPARTSEFDLRFVASPAEAALRDRTKRENADRGLYSELGFDIRHLNLHSVVETATKYHEQTGGRYYSWQGPSDIRPRAPPRLSTRINNHILPDRYGTLKLYTVAANEELEFAGTDGDGEEYAFETGDTGSQAGSNSSPDQGGSK